MLKKGLEEIDNYAKRSKFALAKLNSFARKFRSSRVKRIAFFGLKSFNQTFDISNYLFSKGLAQKLKIFNRMK